MDLFETLRFHLRVNVNLCKKMPNNIFDSLIFYYEIKLILNNLGYIKFVLHTFCDLTFVINLLDCIK